MSIGVSEPRIRASATRQADFLVRLTQRRLLERFARIDDAARQRDLSAVPAERVRANGQHEMGAAVDRKDQQQARRMANSGGIESVGPLTPRLRGENGLCGCAGEDAAQTIRQTFDDIIKMHGSATPSGGSAARVIHDWTCSQATRGGGFADALFQI